MKLPVAILFANVKGNIGDFAILHAALVQLNKIFPDHPVHVFPHDHLPVDQIRLDAFQKSGVPEFILKQWSFSKPFPESLKILRRFGLGPFLQARFINYLSSEARKGAEQFAAYKALFIAGGAQWEHYAGNAMFAGVKAAHEHNQQIFTFPFSIQKKVFEVNSKIDLKHYFSKIRSPLFVRDAYSKNLIETLGIRSAHVSDCVFSLKAHAEGIPAAQGVDHSRVLLMATKLDKKSFTLLGRIISDLKEAGNQVELLTTSESADGNLYRKLSLEHRIPFHAPLTWQEAVAHLKSCSIVITNRLQGVVFAHLACSTILPILNRSKTRAIVQDAKLPFYIANLEDLSISLIEKAKENGEAIANAMSSYCSESKGEIFVALD